MAVKSEQVEKNLIKLTFEVAPEEFAKAINKAYLKNAKKYSVPGFRKGKVPRAVIEKYYTEAVFYDDAINIILPDAYAGALKEADIIPAARPELDIDEIKSGEPVKFTALVTTKPEPELGDYIGVKVQKIEHNVTDEEVDKEIEDTRKKNARLIPADDRPIENGDVATIDFEGFAEGVAFEGGKGENYDLEIGSNTFIPGFEEQIIGAKVNDTVEVKVTFPEEYHTPNLAGKPATFNVTVKEIKAKELPELDDDFAAEVSEFENLADYKKSVKEKLEKAAEQQVKADTENAVIDVVVENSKVDVPAAMINEQAEKIVANFEQRLKYQGMDLKMYLQYTGNTMDAFKEGFKPQAEKQLKTSLIIEAISKAEGIEVTDEEVNDRIAEMAKQYNMEADKLKELMQGNDIDNLKNDIAMSKTVDMLVNKAKITKPRAKKAKAESDAE